MCGKHSHTVLIKHMLPTVEMLFSGFSVRMGVGRCFHELKVAAKKEFLFLGSSAAQFFFLNKEDVIINCSMVCVYLS